MSITRQAWPLLSLLLLSGAAEAGHPALCGNASSWSSATFVSASSHEAGTGVSIQRYSDAVRIDLHSPGRQKSLIMLETGERLFRGTRSGNEDFRFADIAAGAPIHYLQQRFPTPCDARRAAAFHLRIGKDDRSSGGADSVTGTIDADNDSLQYTLDFHANGASKPQKRIHGKWSAAAMIPIPFDTPIGGWSVQRNNTGPIENIQSTTIQDFQQGEQARGGSR